MQIELTLMEASSQAQINLYWMEASNQVSYLHQEEKTQMIEPMIQIKKRIH
jgi:hypothetical protein